MQKESGGFDGGSDSDVREPHERKKAHLVTENIQWAIRYLSGPHAFCPSS